MIHCSGYHPIERSETGRIDTRCVADTPELDSMMKLQVEKSGVMVCLLLVVLMVGWPATTTAGFIVGKCPYKTPVISSLCQTDPNL